RAEGATSTGAMKPGDTDALADFAIAHGGPKRFDRTDDLVTWNDGRAAQLEVAFDDMQVGATNTAGVHFDEDFVGGGCGDVYVAETQGMRFDGGGGVEENGSHDASLHGRGHWHWHCPSPTLPPMWLWLSLLAVPVVGPAVVAWKIWDEIRRTISEDPLVWETQIRAFERRERKRPEAKGAVVFVGSSTIRFWRNLAQDMSPLPSVQRGFGGAKVNDVVHYMDRLITSHDPDMVVLYIGTNDMLDFAGNRPKSVEQMKTLYDTLLSRLHERLPKARILVLGTFPSPLNARRASEINEVNEYLTKAAESRPWLDLIDGNSALQTPSGEPDRSLFLFDRVHLNKKGYARWAQILRPKLLDHWRQRLH
ncbi:MAG: GDSL-type esterase/lipase family protein, partial [Polyangiales bacterium]